MVSSADLISPDYQKFTLSDDGTRFETVGARMQQKIQALPGIDLYGKTVLDIGTDHGFWIYRAAHLGARQALGLDRGRVLSRQHHFTDLVAENTKRTSRYPALAEVCSFRSLNLGRQWHELGHFDVVFCMAMYHHVFQNAGGDHAPIWYWLSRHVAPGGVLVWEGPFDPADATVARYVDKQYYPAYTRADILGAASVYFEAERIGPAIYSDTREVYLFRPRADAPLPQQMTARARDGVKGASRAMVARDGARAAEVEEILGYRPFPGSLNIEYGGAPDLRRGYYRASILECPRGNTDAPASAWRPRMAKFYPLTINGIQAHAVFFEDKHHRPGLTECYSPVRLRDHFTEDEELSVAW